MSVTHVTDSAVILDRAEREALRNELAAQAGDMGDFNIALDRGLRERVREYLERLHTVVALLDEIGWTPADGSVPVVVTAGQAQWLADAADDLESALNGGDDWGEHRAGAELALATMRRLTASVRQ